MCDPVSGWPSPNSAPGHELYRLLLLTHKLMGDGNAFQCLVHGCGADGGQHTGLAVPQHPADTACHGPAGESKGIEDFWTRGRGKQGVESLTGWFTNPDDLASAQQQP